MKKQPIEIIKDFNAYAIFTVIISAFLAGSVKLGFDIAEDVRERRYYRELRKESECCEDDEYEYSEEDEDDTECN